jgi:hypothetical protein
MHIGGGYPEKESGLAKITLEWMLREAVAAGLSSSMPKASNGSSARAMRVWPSPTSNAMMHQSLKGVWWVAPVTSI